ncbi:ketopantoate reductase family protein [Aquimarina brevivitae]|uniref:2-dehydropantoate 2-reductase n=1 Tax=Aquimarina brevivitae TaxID=323412 RepID=A0A4Q7PIJ4_9FLAO|nr:2-dehydropantoate 2-reductase [Aquimarina brevivitae]RZS99630.1 ketopantoate reductase [Aquimarina brevivitae]
MHTVIMGTGGVGGYFGGKIAQSGQQVTFIARGKHLEALQQNGLKVKSIEGDFSVPSVTATDAIAKVGKADVILLSTKAWQVTEAASQLQPLLKKETVVIPLQNGADNADNVGDVIDPSHVLGGLCKIYSKIEAPGVIHHFGYPPEIVFGELDNSKTARLQHIKAIFDKAGVTNTIAENIQVAIWNKFMFIATLSGLGALTRATIGELYQDESLQKMLRDTATEIYKVAKAKKIPLQPNTVDTILNFISKQPYDSTTSTQRDILEGRPSELENFNGYIVAEGKKLAIPTPVNEFVYACLQPMERKARDSK